MKPDTKAAEKGVSRRATQSEREAGGEKGGKLSSSESSPRDVHP